MDTDERPVIPLLEFDESRTAFIEPGDVFTPVDGPTACVLSWFHDGIDRAVDRLGGRLLASHRWEDGQHQVFEAEFAGQRIGLAPMPVCGAAAGNWLEELIARGFHAFIACGGAGSLRPEVTLGHLVVVTSALRDEGLSHHYLPPGRVVDADSGAVSALHTVLTDHEVPFIAGRTWTTDAFFRETPAKIAARRDEGCLTVEMEAASIAAVAQFRDVRLAQLLYGGDDLSGSTWDHRSWQSQHDIRDNMLEFAMEAALRLAADHDPHTQ